MSWLTQEEAIHSAFEYRWRGSKSTEPILITDFDINNLRIVEVFPGAWNDAATWSASERLMTDAEFAAINGYINHTRGTMALGQEVMQEQGRPVRVRGYIMRPGWTGQHENPGWKATVDLNSIRRQIDADVPDRHSR